MLQPDYNRHMNVAGKGLQMLDLAGRYMRALT
jgi:hypothetical protein